MKQRQIRKLSLIVLIISLILASCAQSMQARRTDYVSRNPHLSNETKELILNGKIAIGMSRDDVISSWGSPDDYMTGSKENSIIEVLQYNIDKVNSWFGLTPDQVNLLSQQNFKPKQRAYLLGFINGKLVEYQTTE